MIFKQYLMQMKLLVLGGNGGGGKMGREYTRLKSLSPINKDLQNDLRLYILAEDFSR